MKMLQNKKVKSKVVKPKAVAKKKPIPKKQTPENHQDETSNERTVRKANEKRSAENKELIGEASPAKRKKSQEKTNEVIVETNADQVSARFLEDDNFVDMDISGIRHEFPSEEDEEDLTEDEEEEANHSDAEEPPSSINNNATIVRRKDSNGDGTESALSASSRKRPSTQTKTTDHRDYSEETQGCHSK